VDRATKQAEIANLTDKFQRAKAFFIADYKGMNVEQVTTLRKELSMQKIEMKVVKNTLALRALNGMPYQSEVEPDLIGTNAVIFAYSDPVGPAKTLTKFAGEFEHLSLKSGVLEGKKLNEAAIKALSSLPSKEVLLAKLMGSMNAPASNLVGVMAAIPRSVVNVLNAYKQKLEGQSAS